MVQRTTVWTRSRQPARKAAVNRHRLFIRAGLHSPERNNAVPHWFAASRFGSLFTPQGMSPQCKARSRAARRPKTSSLWAPGRKAPSPTVWPRHVRSIGVRSRALCRCSYCRRLVFLWPVLDGDRMIRSMDTCFRSNAQIRSVRFGRCNPLEVAQTQTPPNSTTGSVRCGMGDGSATCW
jgi:hypothetical protein